MHLPHRPGVRAVCALFLAYAAPVFSAATLGAQEAPRPHVVKVVGGRHKLVLRSDGTVVGWGVYSQGQLGPVAPLLSPLQTVDRLVSIELPGKAIDVAAAEVTSYALLEDGSVWAWGAGAAGELGTGPKPALAKLPSNNPAFEYRGAERPVRVAVDGVAQIAAAGYNAFAIRGDGTVWAWGARVSGLIGDGRHVRGSGDVREPAFAPAAVPGVGGVIRISASGSHVLALTSEGHVLSWGSNGTGALGREPKQDPALDIPAEVPGLTDVVAVAAGYLVSTVVKRDGTVWVWGSNGQGQFGNGTRASNERVDNVLVPTRVPGVAGAVAVTTGLAGRHTLVLLKDGTLRGWGNTDFGQIGAGMTAGFQNAPVTPKITGVAAVFAVGNNTFAVKSDHTFWAWGDGGPRAWPLPGWTKVPVLLPLK